MACLDYKKINNEMRRFFGRFFLRNKTYNNVYEWFSNLAEGLKKSWVLWPNAVVW